ncbi:MAG: ECF transporter S component [Eubacteriales bacterium]
MLKKIKTAIKYIFLLLIIPAVIIAGYLLLGGKKYLWISLCVCLLSFVPFFFSFEKRNVGTKKMVVLAVMVALSVLGRFVFSFIPHFKPVAAIVVITGIYLGAESGFLCGALSALISNIIFGQGPWTPFQMFAWGVIGLFAAIFSVFLKKSKISLSVYGFLSGVIYSLIMDIYTVIFADGVFNFSRYLAVLLTSLPVTAIYAFSNVLFLLLLSRPIGEKLMRISIKYGL